MQSTTTISMCLNCGERNRVPQTIFKEEGNERRSNIENIKKWCEHNQQKNDDYSSIHISRMGKALFIRIGFLFVWRQGKKGKGT